jgi:hypothetical protein
LARFRSVDFMAAITIHIGAPKTATSSLQAILASNDASLLAQGILYPKSCRSGNAHHPLICDLIEHYQGISMPDVWFGDVPRGQSWSRLNQEIDESGGHVQSVVISSELFFGQARHLESMVEDIQRNLRGHTVRVIAYLRRQDQMYGSFYNQDVKGMRQWADDAYHFFEAHQLFRRDYHSLMAVWGRALGDGSVLIRPYEKSQWVGGDIVSDFCSVTGLPPLSPGSVQSNPGLGANQLYFKRCLNRIGFDKALNGKVVELVAHLCPEAPTESHLYIHRPLYARYRQSWLQCNGRLSEDFLDGRELFEQPIPEPSELQLYELSPQTLVSCLQALVHYFSKGGDAAIRPLFTRAAMLMIAEQNLWSQLDAGVLDELEGWL